jgi:nucleoside-diphosphate-sugar epimerase
VRSGGGADQVTIWGSGTPRREFLHVDDRADACLFLLEHYEAEMPINVGSGFDVTILELAQLIARATGFCGRFEFDRTKPDTDPIELSPARDASRSSSGRNGLRNRQVFPRRAAPPVRSPYPEALCGSDRSVR